MSGPRLRLSDDLEIDTEEPSVKNQDLRVAVIGDSGSGKSWAIAVMVEHAIQQGLHVVFIDPTASTGTWPRSPMLS